MLASLITWPKMALHVLQNLQVIVRVRAYHGAIMAHRETSNGSDLLECYSELVQKLCLDALSVAK